MAGADGAVKGFGVLRLIVPLLALGASACTGVSVAEEARPAGGQIIVKFRDPAFDPARGDFLVKLSGDYGIKLIHVRPMSGGAHVLRVAGAHNAQEVERAVVMLRARVDVLYAEPDQPMRALGEN